MAAWLQSRWSYAGIGLVLAILIGFALNWLLGLSLWVAIPLGILALVLNGFLAEWEDKRPGGFNNPR